MRTPKKITRKWLERHKACTIQVDTFAEEWPNGTALTRESLRRAVVLGLDVWWLSIELLTSKQYRDFDKATDPAWKRYYRGTETSRRHANYMKAVANALADALGLS